MNKKPIIASVLSLSLLATPFSMNLAKASDFPAVVEADQASDVYEIDGVKYTVTESKGYRTVVAELPKGKQTFKTNLSTGVISVESDFLNEVKRKELENEVSKIKVTKVKNAEADGAALTINDETLKPGVGTDVDIDAITGSWVWSSWDYYTVTADWKAGAQVVTQAILSLIPKVGWAAGALANVWIQFQLKTGYFKRRGATAADTDPNYLWSKMQVNLYKDSARTNLLSSKTSSPQKVRVY